MRAKIFLALGTVAVTLLALELLLALCAPQRTMNDFLATRAPMYRQGADGITELIPGFTGRERAHEGEYDVAVRINSRGYRQAELDGASGNRMRIVAIGDSFTFGHGVESEDAWPRALAGELAARGSGPVEVINAGVDGRWVDEYYLELTRRSLALAPAAVIVGFFIGNDIDGDDARTHVWRRVDERGRPLQIEIPGYAVEDGYRVHRPTQLRWRLPLLRNSHVAQVFFGAWKSLAAHWQPPELGEDLLYAPVYAPETERAVAQVEDLFAAMQETCAARGARVLVLIIPTRAQVSAPPGRGAEGPDWEKPQRIFTAFFAQRGIDFLDLLPTLRAAAAEAPVYFRDDAHWTARGHLVAARAVADVLARGGYLTPAPTAQTFE